MVSIWTKSHVPNWFVFERIKQKAVSKADSLNDKFLSYPRIKLWMWQTLELNDVEHEVLLSFFSQKLHRKNS